MGLKPGDLVSIKHREDLNKHYTPNIVVAEVLSRYSHLVFKVVSSTSVLVELTLDGKPCNSVGGWEIWEQNKNSICGRLFE